MKKLFLLLFSLPLLFFASCSSDDDLANVELEVTMSNVTKVGNVFYAVKGTDVTIDGVSVKSLTDKAAGVTGVRYFIDDIPLIGSIENPYACEFSTDVLKVNTIHTIAVAATVLQVDKTITQAALNFAFVVVDSAEDLPADAPAIGTYSISAVMSKK